MPDENKNENCHHHHGGDKGFWGGAYFLTIIGAAVYFRRACRRFLGRGSRSPQGSCMAGSCTLQGTRIPEVISWRGLLNHG